MIGHFQSSVLARNRNRLPFYFSTKDTGNIPGPNAVPGCVLWMKADTIGSTDGATVSAWADLSGLGHNFTSQAGTTVLKTNILNGYPIVRFSSSRIAGPNILASKTSMTVFLVYAIRSGDINIFMEQGNSDFSFEHASGLTPRFYVGNSGGATGTTAETNNVFRLHTLRADGSQLTHYINQVAGTPQSFSGNTSSSVMNIGGRADNSFLSASDLAEIVIFDNDISSGNRADVEAYLMGKYAL